MNLYSVILLGFCLMGVGIMVWGWKVIAKGKVKKAWPTVEGCISQSNKVGGVGDLFPNIVYRYDVDGQSIEKELDYPGGTEPTPEFVNSYLKKYPVGTPVLVYYNPQQVQDATLEPTQGSDWIIFTLGALMAVFGLIFFLSGQ
jgi:hypothetical protein